MTTEAAAGLVDGGDVWFVHVGIEPGFGDASLIPGSVLWQWRDDLREESGLIVDSHRFLALLSKSGIGPETRIVLSDAHNLWFASWAYWMLYSVGHQNVHLLDGGTQKWIAEGRPTTSEPAVPKPEAYPDQDFDQFYRGQVGDVLHALRFRERVVLLDARSPGEFQGEDGSAFGTLPVCSAQGHLPGAVNIPWHVNLNEDRTFKSWPELYGIYAGEGIDRHSCVITYCTYGERASLSWFVLHRLLRVRTALNYEGSLAEWAQLAGCRSKGEAA
ncbi:MAG: sulfurtransferase [Fimbriimonadaceae bacterium]|nr:sulfurtransferase [Fimbriimonadaceae bacterium]QYK56987.1 MAG: sulfurtransferase [Fimbriimonadaceae bacterium]